MRYSSALFTGALLFGIAAGCSSEESSPDKEPAGPDLSENFPGELVITSPARGAFIPIDSIPVEAGGQIVVAGNGASAALQINGQPVTVGEDGSFTTSITPVVGLNLIRAIDGDSAVDTPIVYGRFAPWTESVPSAVALRINQAGFPNDNAAVVSLTLLGQRALDDMNLLSPLQGQTLTGSIPGGSWTFQVQSTSYGATGVELYPRAGGAAFDAQIDDVKVDGKLTIKVLLSKTDDVAMTVDAVTVNGNVDAALQGPSLVGSTSGVQTQLYGFKYDSNNAGFPCCVDSIVTSYLRPKVQAAVQDKVREALGQELAFALNQFALPSSFDLSKTGFPVTLDIETGLDAAFFEASGATLGAAARFSSVIPPGAIGEVAPGWLAVGQGPALGSGPSAFGISLSVDSLNQALAAAWAQNGLRRTIVGLPVVDAVDIEPRLPPIVLPNGQGGLIASAGEVVMHATVGGVPIQAAVTVIGDVGVSLDPTGQELVLTPSSEPTISVTWLLSEGLDDAVRDVIKSMIADTLPTLLTPISIPLPSLPLGNIASSFDGMVGALGPATTLGIDPALARVDLHGDLAIVAAPTGP